MTVRMKIGGGLPLAMALWLQTLPAAAEQADGDAGIVSRAFQASIQRVEDYRRALHQWDRSVRGFRQDHHFSIDGGRSTGRGSRKTTTDTGEQTSTDASTAAWFWKFSYSFHMKIYKGFGYYLGSSFGYVGEEESDAGDLRIERSLSMPGLIAGLSLNISPAFRLMAGTDLHLERIERLERTDAAGQESNVYTTARVASFHVLGDIFFRLHWAVRLRFESREVEYPGLTAVGGYTGLEEPIHKTSRRIGFGLVYHLI